MIKERQGDADSRIRSMVNNAGLGTTARSTRLHEQEDQEWDTIMYDPSLIRAELLI